MSPLHSALQSLGPIAFSDVPTDQTELDNFVTDLFSQSQLILESIPIADSAPAEQQVSDKPLVAASAAEIKLSIARSAPPIDEYASLQKEWGKPMKLAAKENPLGMSVYKASAKDGKGAWFARRSVHEGLGFAKFKKCLQEEFEESLATHGAPGEGNVRGIGGEERVEKLDVPGRGTVEVFRLSAQFPGPTTPRDFVTLLVTSDNAMRPGKESQTTIPRHYMVISKPVDHPETQPKQGFVRGSYESVEFIREVPRKLKTSMSTTDLDETSQKDTSRLGKDAMIRNAHQKIKHSADATTEKELSADPAVRTRSFTAPQTPTLGVGKEGQYDESNPVEWIMVTRSDPGGSVPRFMVERGTPGSICADASKFLDWACRQDTVEEGDQEQSSSKLDIPNRPAARRGSFQSFRSSRLAGLEDGEGRSAGADATADDAGQIGTSDAPAQNSGLMGAVVGAVSAYTPQIVLNHLPGGGGNADTHAQATESHKQPEGDDDNVSMLSSTSFQSAEDRISSPSDEEGDVDNHDKVSELISNSSMSSLSKAQAKKQDKDTKTHAHHERELEKLEQRRVALESKFADSRSKLDQQITSQSVKEEAAHKKATEKRKKDLQKHEEKYAKEMAKLEERARKERAKLEEKERKQEHKNELDKIARERDDARREVDLGKREIEMLHGIIADLQKENAALLADLGRPAVAASSDTRSESASVRTNRSSEEQ